MPLNRPRQFGRYSEARYQSGLAQFFGNTDLMYGPSAHSADLFNTSGRAARQSVGIAPSCELAYIFSVALRPRILINETIVVNLSNRTQILPVTFAVRAQGVAAFLPFPRLIVFAPLILSFQG